MIDGQLLGGQRRDHARPYRATSNMKAESFALLSPELISRFLLEGYFFFGFIISSSVATVAESKHCGGIWVGRSMKKVGLVP